MDLKSRVETRQMAPYASPPNAIKAAQSTKPFVCLCESIVSVLIIKNKSEFKANENLY